MQVCFSITHKNTNVYTNVLNRVVSRCTENVYRVRQTECVLVSGPFSLLFITITNITRFTGSKQ